MFKKAARERKFCVRIFNFESNSRAILDQKVMHQESIYLIPKSKKLKIVSLRMFVAVKQDDTLKARRVARGFLQREGINYRERRENNVDSFLKKKRKKIQKRQVFLFVSPAFFLLFFQSCCPSKKHRETHAYKDNPLCAINTRTKTQL